MNDKQFAIISGLKNRHELYKDLLSPEEFEKEVEEWSPVFDAYQEKLQTSSILETALEMGKLLVAAGEDPNKMFAISVELMERENQRPPHYQLSPASGHRSRN
jgi:hypothetical protein